MFAPKPGNTRPITNLAAWFAVFTGILFTRREQQRELWLHKTMHGARPRHEIFHVSLAMNMIVETQQNRGVKFTGAALDRQKFFDLMEHEIIAGSSSTLGYQKRENDAMEAFYAKLQCRCKIGKAVSGTWKR